MESPNTWIILPTYNEAENIAPLLQRLLSGSESQIVVVDGSSPDGTADIARGFTSRVEVVSVESRAGVGGAYRAGFQYAIERGAEIIIQMDADFSHDPDHVQKIIDALGDSDLVLGSRYIPDGGTANWSRWRKMLSQTGNFYARNLLRLPLQDLTGGFKGWRRQTLLGTKWSQSRGYVFQIEMTLGAVESGFRVRETPIVFRGRVRGDSKITLGIVLEAAWRIFLISLRKIFRK